MTKFSSVFWSSKNTLKKPDRQLEPSQFSSKLDCPINLKLPKLESKCRVLIFNDTKSSEFHHFSVIGIFCHWKESQLEISLQNDYLLNFIPFTKNTYFISLTSLLTQLKYWIPYLVFNVRNYKVLSCNGINMRLFFQTH